MQGFRVQSRGLFEQKSSTSAEMRIIDTCLNNDNVEEPELRPVPDIWTSPTTGIQIVVTSTGEEASTVTSVDLQSFSFAEGSEEKEYLDTKNLISKMKLGTSFYLQIYRVSKNLFFMKYYTGSMSGMDYLTSAVTLRMFRISSDGVLTLGGAVTIAGASTAAAYTHAHLLAAINEGKTPNDFMVLQTSTATATAITTYSIAAIFMNLSTLAIVSTGSGGAMAWASLGNDGANEFNMLPIYSSTGEYMEHSSLSAGESIDEVLKWYEMVDPERYCAYLTSKNLTSGAVNHRILYSRQTGIQSLNVAADVAVLSNYRISGACSAGLLLINPREDYSSYNVQWKLAHLNLTTGELEELE